MKNLLRFIAIVLTVASLSSCQKELINPGNTPVKIDVDAQKFIDSTGITDSTLKLAIDSYVKQLKDSSLWTKFKAIYPMLGGTSASAKWNLKDPRNTDDAYRLTFNGSPVFASTGVLFQTSADYADSHLTDGALTYNDNSISYYSRTQNNVAGYDMGCNDASSPYNEFAIYDTTDASNWFGYYAFGAKPAITKGLFMLSSTSVDVKRFENGIVTNAKGSAPVSGATNMSILIGTVANASFGGQRECALATIGSGLTDAQTLTFYNIVQKFISALGR
ncbi:MAG: hypothetical protein M3Z26_02860 [Bacteroidota bacterium]|nr:hypothetical protein [Bacteroidota bacterium]